MSVVTEVLTSAGQIDKQEVHGKVKALTDHIKDLQHGIYNSITERYIDFYPSYNSVSDLANEVDSVKNQIEAVSNKIDSEIKDQLNVSTAEFQTLTRELQEVNGILLVLKTLVELQDALEDVAKANKQKKFGQAADCLANIHDILSRPLLNGEFEIKILNALNTENKIQKQKLIFDLNDVWKEHVVWISPEPKSTSGNLIELKLITGKDSLQVLENMISAMEKLNILDSKIKAFGELFVKHIVKNLLLQDAVDLKEMSTSKEKSLKLTLKSKVEHMPLNVNLFRKFNLVMDFLADSFFKLTVKWKEKEISLLELLGYGIADTVVDLIIKDCLSHAIPSQTEKLADFFKVIDSTETFQKGLMDAKFLPESNTALMNYVGNVNVLFAKKKCQEILEKARKLITSDIHDTFEVSPDVTLHPLPPLLKDKSISTSTPPVQLAHEEKLSPDAFKLPKCRISLSINNVVNLAYEILSEASSSSPECAVQMFYAVRNIFELFCSVFPTYHRQSLNALPQFSALHHNNCMFISHHLMTLGHQFSLKLPPTINSTFVDLIPKIRGIGTQSFMDQMNSQRDLLLEFLQAANGFADMSNEEKYTVGEKSIIQCLHQLSHLQNVWKDILPVNIYRKAIGMLINTVVVDIIESVTTLEDISSFDAKQLDTLMSTLSKKAEPFFAIEGDDGNPNIELQRNVTKWNKFKELNLVLNANLQDISDRWADGKGPLAMAFTPNELKQLIRALFQNTDRRATVLAKIK
ncbi:hypothetical protein LOTGIDRAFT_225294 [Lottia gigantea]|uniref:Centromere/kinetochore protein zw10 homolog n=1 Tax=Lottia gigantea TaxID=225164 RepID=V4B230_LOTGI|nr:hypothetical protein LOTGIDRAFT_225294 [Lottia gigantea]ESP01626.1 hypothetical protein LOTGIDRAFT_225294 [Lottia gigantea]